MGASRASATLALGVAFAVFAGQLAQSAHDPSAHVICPEHGDLLHADHAGRRGSVPAEPQLESTPVDGEHGSHCVHAVVVGEEGRSLVLVAPVRALGASVVAERAAPQPPIAILHLAPKASPPLSS
jgi:hypothetical protein